MILAVILLLINCLLVWLIFLAGWKFGVPPDGFDNWRAWADYKAVTGNHPPIMYTTPAGTRELRPDWELPKDITDYENS